MIDNRILPTVLIVIDILAGMNYLSNGNIKECIYWLSAATLTATVTY